jgi:hypothetical protein
VLNSEVFYAVLATSAAAVLGIGGGFLATRYVSLIERGAQLRREEGDLLNRSTVPQQGHVVEWERRSRADELADLHDLATRVRTTVRLPLASAAILVALPLGVLAGWLPDLSILRAIVTAVFVVAIGLWWWMLDQLIGDLISVTRSYADRRDRRRKAASARGEPYLQTGDPEQLAKNVEKLVTETGGPKWRMRWRLLKVRRRARRPPLL